MVIQALTSKRWDTRKSRPSSLRRQFPHLYGNGACDCTAHVRGKAEMESLLFNRSALPDLQSLCSFGPPGGSAHAQIALTALRHSSANLYGLRSARRYYACAQPQASTSRRRWGTRGGGAEGRWGSWHKGDTGTFGVRCEAFRGTYRTLGGTGLHGSILGCPKVTSPNGRCPHFRGVPS